jgi:hypothetical protein
MPVMLITGPRRRRLHRALGMVFLVLWGGTCVTGFLLPHAAL